MGKAEIDARILVIIIIACEHAAATLRSTKYRLQRSLVEEAMKRLKVPALSFLDFLHQILIKIESHRKWENV